MSIIYQPKGKAREYSPYAANLYTGCDHGCVYCYTPGIMRKTREEFKKPVPRKNIIKLFEKEIIKHSEKGTQVFLSFITDPYNSSEIEYQVTREALKIALQHRVPIVILTKSSLVLRDIDLFKQFGTNIRVGMTLTFMDVKSSQEYEPYAALPADRLYTLQKLKEHNIPTWASFEPIIFPSHTSFLLRKTIPWVDYYKIGKLNNYNGFDELLIDLSPAFWRRFYHGVLNLLRENNKQFYIKESLRSAGLVLGLRDEEKNMDQHVLAEWQAVYSEAI